MSRSRSFAAFMALAMSIGLVPASGAVAQDQSAAPDDAAGTTMPFAGMLMGSANFQPLDPPTEECPMVRTIIDATGQTTVGEVTVRAVQCPTMAPGIPSAPNGQMTLTTVAGDELQVVYFVDCDPVVPSAPAGEIVWCTGRLDVIGGTGQYEGASGSARQEGGVWFSGDMAVPDWPWVDTFEGWLTY